MSIAGSAQTLSSGSGKVSKIVKSFETLEGAGFRVRVPFPSRQVSDQETDPFLLLHEMGPVQITPGNAKGAPDHPHRGFETVTYIIEGSSQHKDSTGLTGNLLPGDVQWMTAGRGVVHSEMPSTELQENGGRMHGFQLWVNLPRKDKFIDPRYQDVPNGSIPVVESPDRAIRVKVIAGESMGAVSAIETRIPILYLHITLQPGAAMEQWVPKGFRVFVYVFEGSATLGCNKQIVDTHEMALFESDSGDIVEISCPGSVSNQTQLLLFGGAPLKEPIARRGPFVMNTEKEVRQSFEDYYNGLMGAIQH